MPKILLVEDNAENRDALSRRLQRRGYDGVIAVDGKKGGAMAQSEGPDGIMLDLRLPEMDGWGVAGTLEAPEGRGSIARRRKPLGRGRGRLLISPNGAAVALLPSLRWGSRLSLARPPNSQGLTPAGYEPAPLTGRKQTR